MRLITVATLIAILPWPAVAAPTWQTVSAEPGKRIELDRTSIKREEGKVQATGRIVLEKELSDPKSGGGYRIIEATTVYDCASRNAATVKRVFKKNETEVLREEEQKAAEMPVRTGTLDDKVLREVCRPAKGDAKEVAQKAAEAAAPAKPHGEAISRAEMIRPARPALPLKTAEAEGHAAAPAKAEEHGKAVPAEPPRARAAARKPRAEPPPVEAAVEHAHIHWSYEGAGGAENWHRIDPNNTLCAAGQRQSPIDIRDGIKVDLEPIQFDYSPSYFRIVDNGHTVQVTPGEGSITITGKTYELIQFHFHRPSEEKVNGRGFDMVAHLVHKSLDNKLAVVAVLLEKGAENPFVQSLWNNLPLEKNVEVAPPAASIDLNTFLPAGRNYYTYMGSLTTPPCTEGVLWLVMRQPVQVSAEQIAIFSRLYRNNARPVQASWGRMIKENR